MKRSTIAINIATIIIAILIITGILLYATGVITFQIADDAENNTAAHTISSFIKINDILYYDENTFIVYVWNGMFRAVNTATMPSAYYAPNGLPYKYDPDTKTLYEINTDQKGQ